MTLSEFEAWLLKNPEQYLSTDPISVDEAACPTLPSVYREFLNRFGPLVLFDYCFLSPSQIVEITKFIHDLSYPAEGVNFHHLTPFFAQGYDMCYLCFDGEKIVDFDPLEPSSMETIIAESFEEFLTKFVNEKGGAFWLNK